MRAPLAVSVAGPYGAFSTNPAATRRSSVRTTVTCVTPMCRARSATRQAPFDRAMASIAST